MGLDNGPRGDYNNVRSFRMKSYNETGRRRDPGRLYSEWSISKQTGHSAVEWLKKRDLVTLEPDPQDRRGKLVVLTPAGKDYIQTKVAPIMQAERAFLRLTQEQREALTTLIRRTTNYFKEEVEALAVRKETEDDDPTL